jgi:hypothetical protein
MFEGGGGSERMVIRGAAMDFGRVAAGEVLGSGMDDAEKGSYRVVGVDGIKSSTKMTLWDVSYDGRSKN